MQLRSLGDTKVSGQNTSEASNAKYFRICNYVTYTAGTALQINPKQNSIVCQAVMGSMLTLNIGFTIQIGGP